MATNIPQTWREGDANKFRMVISLDGSALDLTGAEVVMEVRPKAISENGNLIMRMEIGDGIEVVAPAGNGRVEISPADTTGMLWRTAEYEVKVLASGDTLPSTCAYGQITLVPRKVSSV
jgi:hypothetical protein